MQRSVCAYIACWRLICGLTVAVCPGANIIAQLYGWSEVVTSLAAGINSWKAESFDGRRIGWLLPVLYGLGYVAVPVIHTPAWWLGSTLVLVLWLRVWAFAALGLGYSVGVASWSSLAETGPYRWVRHPMQLSGLLARLVFCLANPFAWNWFAFWLMVVASVGIVVLEEGFLSRVSDWRRYARRVRWRLIPGVW